MSNNKFKVLVVEDEANICSFIETLLETNGYQALVANTCAMGQTLFTSHNPDLIILDLGLPDRDGLELIRFVRQKFLTPIVVLSARTTEQDKIEALDLGANDYLTKPFHFEELEARIRSLTRRKFIQEDVCLRCSRITFDTRTREASVDGTPLALTRKESALLEYFLLHRNRIISPEEMIEHLWDGSVNSFSNSIRVHISSLKKKTENCPWI